MQPRRPVAAFLAAVLAGACLAPVRPGGAAAVEILGDAATSVSLATNQGRLVRLPRAATTVFVANPEIADVQVTSPRLIYLLGKKAGETTLFAVGEGEDLLANVHVAVTHNLVRLRQAVNELHPGQEIAVSSIDGALVLDGVVRSAAVAEDVRRMAARFAGGDDAVINRLSVDAPSQVNLRVRVAEVSREVDKQLGINWNMLGSIGGLSVGLATSNPFTSGVTPHTLSAAGAIRGFDLNAVIDALEDEGLVTVLAEPNLTALSGETASFLAGGEFPILVPDSDGRVTIRFKKFGVSLAFTPTVVDGGRISLHVRPEVSQLSSANAVTLNNFEVPSLTTRRAETTVELGSGQSFAIAGLLQNNVTHDITKFPGLGDVPVLGGLFRSDRFKREESELVILVTPYLTRPVRQARLSSPIDGFAPPHDSERFVTGGTHRRNRAVPAEERVDPDGETLFGPAGFQLD